eukprot:2081365-Pyramimonas_sp.AAC.1
MANVHRGKTTLWEKKANDSVDSYAKMGAAKHLLCESDVKLCRGFKCLLKESAKWAANLEVQLQGQSEKRLDTVGLAAAEK